ncbi:MAG: ureidoglycolate lyase [Planctomycetota bacterium]|jgi:ureidoglycolate lyase|nr:ureidoglycolate lyase [Planctomycetota bacterium]
MPSVKIEELTPESYKPFGTFVNMINPDTEAIGDNPVRFFRDMSLLPIAHPRSLPSFSICRVEKRPLIVDTTEIHSFTAEGNLPLDADALIHVAPAMPNGVCPVDRIRVFRVPRGTFVTMNAGVWHHAPFAYGADVLNMLIVLPERTYANDCLVVELEKKDHVHISR